MTTTIRTHSMLYDFAIHMDGEGRVNIVRNINLATDGTEIFANEKDQAAALSIAYGRVRSDLEILHANALVELARAHAAALAALDGSKITPGGKAR